MKDISARKVMSVLTAAGLAACLCGGAARAEVKKIEATYFTLDYETDAGWTFDEKKDLKDSQKASTLRIRIPSAADPKRSDALVDVKANIENQSNFRRYLEQFGFDPYEYAEKRSYTLVPLGGVDCLVKEDSSRINYLARVEGAGETIQISADSKEKLEDVTTLLKGLQFKVTDAGKKDGPWYWNGTPYASAEHSAEVGSVTLNSKHVPIDPIIIRSVIGGNRIWSDGTRAYILSNACKLAEYALDGGKLVKKADIELGDKANYQTMTVTDDGAVWLGGVGRGACRIKDGAVEKIKGPRELVMHPSGTWGLERSCRKGAEMKKYEIAADGTVATVDFPLAEIDSMVNAYLRIDANHIYVSGREAGSKTTALFVYDHGGKLEKILREPAQNSMGGVFFAGETANGFVALPLQSTVILWDKEGNPIGRLNDVKKLYDSPTTGVAANEDGVLLPGGGLLTLTRRERADKSTYELVVFRVDGF